MSHIVVFKLIADDLRFRFVLLCFQNRNVPVISRVQWQISSEK